MNTLDTIDDVEAALKTWLQSARPDLLAVQPGTNATIKDEHIMFQLIGFDTDGYTCDTASLDDDGNPQLCSVLQSTLTYQIDIMYCCNGFATLLKLLHDMKNGCIRTHGDYDNFSYAGNGNMQRINFFQQQSLRYKSTVDIDFLWKQKQCKPVNTFETVNIGACIDAPALPDLTILKP